MKTLEEALKAWPENITHAQISTIKKKEQLYGNIASVWWDSINDVVMVAWERNDLITGIEKDGECHT